MKESQQRPNPTRIHHCDGFFRSFQVTHSTYWPLMVGLFKNRLTSDAFALLNRQATEELGHLP